MNDSFLCSNISSQVEETLIGSATPFQSFVLIECPFPWSVNAFDSHWIPQSLRDLVALVKMSGLPIRFLLINQAGRVRRIKKQSTTVLVYERAANIFCQGYQRYEWQVNQPEEIAPLVQAYLVGQIPPQVSNRPTRDLLVCVHGSHDQCCGKYGMPFYREAIATISQLNAQLNAQLQDQSIRLWQASHFGGHRFAPTLIDFPTGRYYGRMSQTALRSILTRSGDLQIMPQIYRGWSILPSGLQVAEQALWQYYGWQWFDYKIAYQMISQDPHGIKAKLSVVRSDGWVQSYESYELEVVKDSCKTLCLRTSCGVAQESEQVKYTVQSLVHLNTSQTVTNSHAHIGYEHSVYELSL
jgi:hypothetical protein